MFKHEKQLLKDVRVDGPNPNYANLCQEQIGGPHGELKAALQYITQSFRVKDPAIKDLFLDIASEELGHMEMVMTLVNLLNGHQLDAKNTTVGGVEASTISGLTPLLANASGYPFNGVYIEETGDLASDILSDIASEQRAKVVYEYLYRQIADTGVREAIDFLLNREEAHNTLFREAFNKLEETGSLSDWGVTSDSKQYFDLSTPGRYYDTKNLENPKPPKFSTPNQNSAGNKNIVH
jgi:Mn-containing catalase